MARITVEDCIDKFPSRFELVLVASNRARKLHSGENPTVDKDNDKNTVIALREIADETLTVDQLKNDLVEEYQTTTINEEEEEEINEIEESKEEIEEDNLELDTSDEKKIMSNDADLNYEIKEENSEILPSTNNDETDITNDIEENSLNTEEVETKSD